MIETEIHNKTGESIDYTFHPGVQADALVIIGHGLTGNKDRPQLVALAEGLAARGWPCLRISFSGNGQAGGRFEDSCISKEIGDLQAVLDAVPNNVSIAYVGHSMGAAVGVLTAARDMRIRVLVSLAGMTHTAAFLQREFSNVTPDVGCMWEDENFPLTQSFIQDLMQHEHTLDAAAAVSQPWLLIYGSADDLVPVQDGLDAFDAATCEKRWLEISGAGHSFDESNYPLIVEAVDEWLRLSLQCG